MFLLAHDSDGFNRWDAAQTLLRRVLLDMVGRYREGVEMVVPDGLLEALASVLRNGDGDRALTAEILSLPSLGYLGDFMSTVDVDGLHLARETLRVSIGRALHAELESVYGSLQESGPYEVDPQAIGRRSLKNCALAYLMAADGLAGGERCRAQYEAQHNMTDVIAALARLADSDHPAREAVLADFERRWRTEPLVMDKWFSVQAVSDRSDTLERVQRLMEHPAFSIGNPNKVRALIGAFASGNPVRFHAADGAGYAFLERQVLDLDAANPQIAARLLRAITRWRRYDEGRQEKMRAVLEHVVATKVSKDVYEIASKSLDGA
jgi:aminopeptidase N